MPVYSAAKGVLFDGINRRCREPARGTCSEDRRVRDTELDRDASELITYVHVNDHEHAMSRVAIVHASRTERITITAAQTTHITTRSRQDSARPCVSVRATSTAGSCVGTRLTHDRDGCRFVDPFTDRIRFDKSRWPRRWPLRWPRSREVSSTNVADISGLHARVTRRVDGCVTAVAAFGGPILPSLRRPSRTLRAASRGQRRPP
jgi:hypothetical protein